MFNTLYTRTLDVDTQTPIVPIVTDYCITSDDDILYIKDDALYMRRTSGDSELLMSGAVGVKSADSRFAVLGDDRSIHMFNGERPDTPLCTVYYDGLDWDMITYTERNNIVVYKPDSIVLFNIPDCIRIAQQAIAPCKAMFINGSLYYLSADSMSIYKGESRTAAFRAKTKITSMDTFRDTLYFSTEDGYIYAYWDPGTNGRHELDIVAEKTDLLNAYPNPTGGNLSIGWHELLTQPTKLRILDQVGRTVYTREIPAGETSTAWDGSTASPGIYFLQLQHNDGMEVMKVSIR